MTLWIFLLCLAAVLQQPARCMRGDQPKEIVNKHNDLRRKVRPTASNMLRMKWNPEAAKNSQHWAERCIFSHSPPDRRIVNGKQCGENLYMSSQPTLWSKVIDSWYGEEKYFKYGVGAVRPGAVVGHYTQVVWYKSYEIGCYSAFCPNRNYKHFYVCQYCPAGNIVGSLKTPYKSGPPCGDCPSACDNGLCTNPCKYTDKYSNCKELTDRFGCTPELEGDCAATCRCTTEIK